MSNLQPRAGSPRSLQSPGPGRTVDEVQDATSSTRGMDHHNSFPLSASVTVDHPAIPCGEGD